MRDNDQKNKKELREISVEGCELLGKGGNGAVYRLDDEKIVKVYFSNRADLTKSTGTGRLPELHLFMEYLL